MNIVTQLKQEPAVPLRFPTAAWRLDPRPDGRRAFVDYVQVTLFPVITGQTSLDRLRAATSTSSWWTSAWLNSHVQELTYNPRYR